MKRRDILKVAGAFAALTIVGAEASEKSEAYKNRYKYSIKDSKNPTKAELKHSPRVTLGDKDKNGYTQVDITVGQKGIIHPSVASHWIDFIVLYADGKLVGKNTLEPVISRGFSGFAVKLDDVKSLTAEAGCNLHGVWKTTIKL